MPVRGFSVARTPPRSKRCPAGFMFAEVLTMIVVIAVCLLPILGMLQNSLERSRRYELATVMQNLAESKVNACAERWIYQEAAVAAGITTEHYPDAVTDDLRFAVITRLDPGVAIADGNGNMAAPAGAQAPQFCHLTVKVALDLAWRPDLGSEMPLTNTGLTVTNGNDAVTGVGTSFSREVAAGSFLEIGGVGGPVVMVARVIDDTHLQLSAPWTGASGLLAGSLLLSPLAPPIVLATMMSQP